MEGPGEKPRGEKVVSSRGHTGVSSPWSPGHPGWGFLLSDLYLLRHPHHFTDGNL